MKITTEAQGALGVDVFLINVKDGDSKKKKYILNEPIYMFQQYTYRLSIYSISVTFHSSLTVPYLY